MPSTATKVPFADASPAEIREVLLPEELPQFEEQYREALRAAAETFSFDQLNRTMECWRRVAWMTHADPEAHRLMLARVVYAQHTGEHLPGSGMVSADEMRALLWERLNQ